MKINRRPFNVGQVNLFEMSAARVRLAFERLAMIYGTNPDARCPIVDRLIGLVTELRHPEQSRRAKGSDSEYSRNANEVERRRVGARLNGFVFKDSPAWQMISRRFGENLNQMELLSLAQVLSARLNLKIDREAKRRKEVLIKWYDENFRAISEILPYVYLEDRDGQMVIGEEKDNREN
jgi:hypothetical protein